MIPDCTDSRTPPAWKSTGRTQGRYCEDGAAAGRANRRRRRRHRNARAFGLTRYLEKLLFPVSPADPGTFAAVAFVLAMVALLACYIPARRTLRVDPITALRYE